MYRVTKYLKGTLISVAADNPASNLIGGYKNLHSAFRKCRHCLATAEEIQTKVINFITLIFVSVFVVSFANNFIPRNKAMHERHCSSLDGPAHSMVATTYGVQFNSQ